ncbi:Transcriptional repressor frmR [Bordetella ansorpii]|uniref:Transcriptional repressor frmR n=1 Tax=Bordetella ansorpii TaxID=288768 RepID=A0A157P3N7_9BORD|nr:metal/formaldehyde-sensitive transcriptional repressor [Bordetella ansorpii]SAI28153.1 Transcriptional repressor frmR [Bordetella ansorpii]
MPYSAEDKRRTIVRLRRIKGQTEALERAVEEGVDCSALLQQIAALRGAANGLMAEILQTHLMELFGSTGEARRSREPSDSDAEIESLMKTLRTYLK